jgi:hypothetical protein
MRWAGCVAWGGGEEKFIHSFGGGKLKGKKIPLGRPRRGWEDNIKIYLNGIKCEGVYWIDLTQVMGRGELL